MRRLKFRTIGPTCFRTQARQILYSKCGVVDAQLSDVFLLVRTMGVRLARLPQKARAPVDPLAWEIDVCHALCEQFSIFEELLRCHLFFAVGAQTCAKQYLRALHEFGEK